MRFIIVSSVYITVLYSLFVYAHTVSKYTHSICSWFIHLIQVFPSLSPCSHIAHYNHSQYYSTWLNTVAHVSLYTLCSWQRPLGPNVLHRIELVLRMLLWNNFAVPLECSFCMSLYSHTLYWRMVIGILCIQYIIGLNTRLSGPCTANTCFDCSVQRATGSGNDDETTAALIQL